MTHLGLAAAVGLEVAGADAEEDMTETPETAYL
jgi:hypothetical protein